ncbi:coat protein [Arracacha virus 1]|uniref:Coat protein n=1 Tax=Arracacha virus 1 TaxID=2201042 RepID=A0A2U8JHB1_9CLOS|nr:coat protein [Arracacha virus 1]AWK68098.1 coat protein [Arracacha virus 1]
MGDAAKLLAAKNAAGGTDGTTDDAGQTLGGRLLGLTFGSPVLKTGNDKVKLLKTLGEFMVSKGAKPGEVSDAIGLLLHAYNIRSTSPKVERDVDDILFSAVLSAGSAIVVLEGEVNAWLNNQSELKTHVNKARVLCRTLGDEYIAFLRENHSVLPPVPRANKHGISAAHSYMASDFYTSNKALSNEEQAVHLHGSNHALKTEGKEVTEITSLFQLGRH